ncbi:hypothetical protein [Pseudobutyrivibrio xylanivorans]|uniref:SLH domain-containing protein n=1 Tax=Pseudobutyrivibrio xylanivorans DSM 14809 TaxID=1123012 RepID=A0A1M6E172_PSEXY|nr:hypothetical protein [Pseudobutyrivibrio xylanivorans]SHI79153.1 hypothetical protein SAMN02745725_01117 [Pseudobutyrivibrio xylanivorans DSM 14809]
MRVKKFLAVMMALAVVGTVAAPAVNVKAAGLTQAQDPSQVNYGKLTSEEIAIIKTMFDADFYAKDNPDLAEFYGNDTERLFEHFITLGLFEGRMVNADFDAVAYAAAYKDLKEAFGNNIVQYFVHYATEGKAQGRDLTTVETVTAAGYIINPFYNPEIKITKDVVKVAKLLGTKDYGTVAVATERAAQGEPITVSNGEETFTLTTYKDSNLEEAGKLCLSEDEKHVVLYIYASSSEDAVTGYALYTGHRAPISPDDNPGEIISKTENYNDETAVEFASIRISESDYDRTKDNVSKYYTHVGDPDKANVFTYDAVASYSTEDSSYTERFYREDIGRECTEGTETFDVYHNGKVFASYAYDSNGTDDTVYTVGGKVEMNEDGDAVVSIGAMNEENESATMVTLTIDVPEGGQPVQSYNDWLNYNGN